MAFINSINLDQSVQEEQIIQGLNGLHFTHFIKLSIDRIYLDKMWDYFSPIINQEYQKINQNIKGLLRLSLE